MRKNIVTILVGSIFILLQTQLAFAGFGITPPYVQNDNLTRTSHYEQKIILVRSDPDEDLQASVTIDVPRANEWISIDRGVEFLLPKGERQVPMFVSVDVPEDAQFGNYSGKIKVVISSPGGPRAGTVGISLGAQIDVSIDVIDRKIFEFKVRSVSVEDLEEGHKLWWMFFPGKIRFHMKIENIGNVPSAPTKVEFDIYDARGKELLESTQNLGKMKFVAPFDIAEIIAEIPTKLEPGSYRAVYKIYNRNEIIQENELRLSILPYGTTFEYEGYGFSGLLVRDKAILIGGAILLLIFIAALFWLVYKKLVHRKRDNIK